MNSSESTTITQSESHSLYLEFIFKPLTSLFFEFISDFTARIELIHSVNNLSNIKISINGNLVVDGLNLNNNFIINDNDIILIEVIKNDNNLNSTFKMNGNLNFQ
jgi:hypothetical protein